MIQEILYFKKIIELRNITKASQELHISQPALSIFIRNLEKKYHSPLLIRHKNGITPTNQGKILYTYFSKINNLQKSMQDKVDELNNLSRRNIRIGMIDSVTDKTFDLIQANFLRKYPEINLQINIDNSTRLLAEVEKNNLDFAIITKPHRVNLKRNFIVEYAGKEKMVFVVNRKVEDIEKFNDLQKLRFLSYDKNSTTVKNILDLFNKRKLKFKKITYSTSPYLLLKLVRQNIGFAILPEDMVKKEQKLVIITFPRVNLTREFVIVRLKDSYLNKFMEELIGIIRKGLK